MTARGPMLIVGGYGYDNVGDEAILAGLVTRHAGESISVVSRSPARTTAMHRVPAIGLLQAVPALRRHRTVLIGGGALFSKDVGRVGHLLPWYGLVAAALGRTILVDGVGIDAQTPRFVRMALLPLLRRAERIAVRDRQSLAVLRAWGLDAVVEPDISEAMPPAGPRAGARILETAGVDLRRPVVGLSLTAVNPVLTEAVVAAAIETMDAFPSTQFCFLPMSRHPSVPAHDDMQLALRLQGLRPDARIVGGGAHPAEMLSAFELLSAAICMRFHSLLFAERSGVPIVAVSYAPKTDAWLAEHQMQPVSPSGRAWTDALRDALGSSMLMRTRAS